jgi:hypothetical protein
VALLFGEAQAKELSKQGLTMRKFSNSSGTAFRSGKAKTPSWSELFCDSLAAPRSSFENGIGIRASRSRS